MKLFSVAYGNKLCGILYKRRSILPFLDSNKRGYRVES